MKTLANHHIKSLIFKIWELEDEWETHTQPGYNALGLHTFRNIESLQELGQVVAIQDRIKVLRRCLRKEIGWRKYAWFLFAPLTFYKSL